MKKVLTLVIILITIDAFLVAENTEAGGWEEIWRNISVGKTITPGQQMTATVYNAAVTFTIIDIDGIANNFANNDKIDLMVVGGGKTLTFSGTKTGLINWAKDNKDNLLMAIFGASPETSFSGATNTSFNNQQLLTVISPSPSSSAENKNIAFIPVSIKDVIVKGQYDFMEIGKDKVNAKGSSGLVNYEYKFGENLKYSIGITIPYRQIDVDDNLNSEFKFASFIPYYKHRWYAEKSLIELMINAALNVTYLKSSMFPSGGGYLEYGGGLGMKYAYALATGFDVSAGLSYQICKKKIPSGLVPEELKWLSDAINDLPVEQDLTPSIGFVYRIMPEKLTFRGEAFRIHQLQSGVVSGFRNQTVAIGIFSYKLSKNVEIALGYKRSFEVKNLTDQSVIASLQLRWK
ncbi:MAG: hypothetical protein FJ241_01445 [Nitrospira sp.]|nr:hypothetical protein [Nitrospira sp.]